MTSRSKNRLFAPGILAAVSILTIGSALADSYYFRSRGMLPNPDDQPTAGLSIQNADVRAGSNLKGSLETSIGDAEWVISQTPEMPSLNLEVSSDGVSGAAPNVVQSTIFTVNAQASNGNKSAAANALAVTIYPKVSISGGPDHHIAADVGKPFPSYSNYAVSGIVNTASYELLSDDAPVNISTICPGLTFSDKTGMISGTPTSNCTEKFAVKVTDAFDGSSATSAPFSISAPLTLAGTAKLSYPNEPYSFDLTTLTAGGKKPYSYTLKTGKLPSGLTLASSGTVSGMLSTDAVATAPTITVTDDNGQSASAIIPFRLGVSNARSWGNNNIGKLGDGTRTNSSRPIRVAGNKAYIELAAGGNHSCGVVDDGTVQCWGSNSYGQLGFSGGGSYVPITISGVSGASAISTGENHTCAIIYGAVKCWGRNDKGQLGNGSTTSSSVPVQVNGITSGASKIATGKSHTCAIVYGAVKCWGYNLAGQLGNGSLTNSASPVQVSNLMSSVTAIAAGDNHTCAIVASSAKCWGNNYYGQLGNGTVTNYGEPYPLQVSGLTSNVTFLSAGGNHTCAVISGAAKCWGYNKYGQLGNGSTTNTSLPYQVSGLTMNISSISHGGSHTCAVESGAVKCWGYNSSGQLGNGSTTNSTVPVQVIGMTSNITEVIASGTHTLAR